MISVICFWKSKWLWLLMALMPISSLHANTVSQLFGQLDHPLSADQAFVLQYQQTNDYLALRWTIQDDYYLYQDKLSLTTDAGMHIPLGDLPAATSKNDPLFGDTLIYTGELFIKIALPQSLLTSDIQSNITQLTLAYQGCWEGGVCYPVQRQSISMDIKATQTSTLAMDDYQNVTLGLTSQKQSASSNQVIFQNQTISQNQNNSAQWYLDRLNQVDTWLILVVFLVAGIGLSLTPCVLPMVPILSNLIVGMIPKPSLGKSFLLSLCYVLAMALTYSALGALVGLSGANLQKYLQHPWIISGVALLFVALAGVMFGFYSMSMPTAWQTRFHHLSNSLVGGQFLSICLMGIISALVVGPCVTAPLAGALLYIGQTGDAWLGAWTLFFLGLGMGMPLLLVGMGAGHWLPKAGAWTTRIKVGFGFVMLYMALWMLDRIVPDVAVGLFIILTLLLAIVFWQVRRWKPPIQSKLGLGITYIAALLLTLYSVSLSVAWINGYGLRVGSLMMPAQFLSSLQNDSFTTSAGTFNLDKITLKQLADYRQQAVNNQQPLMVEVYADWCVSCQELEVFIYSNKEVQAALTYYDAIKLDMTEVTPEIEAFLRQYNLFGPPALLFFDRQGQWQPHLTLVGVPETTQLVHVLQSVSDRD